MFMKFISNSISCCFQFAEVDVLDRLPFLFENLRSLVITVDFTEMFAILAFFCLLRSAPVLEELTVCVMLNCHLRILSSINCFVMLLIVFFSFFSVGME